MVCDPSLTNLLLTVPGIWVWDWTLQQAQSMYAALEKELISEKAFPKVFAWVDRFRDAYEAAAQKNGRAEAISDKDAIGKILSADYCEPDGEVDRLDPLLLSKGQMVDINPVDAGFTHHDKGELLSLGVKEVVIKKEVPNGKGHIRVHFPRINFSVKPLQEANL
jgi:hypothetical protein